MMHEQANYHDEAANHQLPIPAASWIIWIVSAEECSSLTKKTDADSLLYLFSHFEGDGHTGHMLIHLHLPPPLTGTVKSSLFTHAHSSPLALAARLHQCHADCSHCINNGCTFSRQTSYTTFKCATPRPAHRATWGISNFEWGTAQKNTRK